MPRKPRRPHASQAARGWRLGCLRVCVSVTGALCLRARSYTACHWQKGLVWVASASVCRAWHRRPLSVFVSRSSFLTRTPACPLSALRRSSSTRAATSARSTKTLPTGCLTWSVHARALGLLCRARVSARALRLLCRARVSVHARALGLMCSCTSLDPLLCTCASDRVRVSLPAEGGLRASASVCSVCVRDVRLCA